MTTTKFIKINSHKQFKYFDKFANKNWNEHPSDADSSNDFFAIPSYVACLYENKTKVSSLFIFIRNIEIKGKQYIMAGIGGVVTSIEHRRHGYALKLLAETSNLLENKADFCLLCTEIETTGKLYSKAGYIPLQKDYYFIDKRNQTKAENGGMILILNKDIKPEAILEKSVDINVGLSNF